MKTLFLTSITENVLDKFSALIDKKPKDTKVAFIPTAADPYQDKSFMESDREKWLKSSYDLQEVDIKNKSKEQIYNELKDFDVIYLSGGNAFYLLQEANKCGLKEVLEKLLEQGKIYAGGSAGAAIAGPSIDPLKTVDNPAEASELHDYRAFGFVDFTVLPHFDSKKYNSKFREILKKYNNTGLKLQPLNNNQAVFIRGSKVRIIQ